MLRDANDRLWTGVLDTPTSQIDVDQLRRFFASWDHSFTASQFVVEP